MENTHEEEEEREPFQLTAVMKRPSSENDLTTRQEDNSLSEDLHTSFVLGSGRRQDHHVDIDDNEIILASNRSLFRNITFTLNRWAHLMTALDDTDTVVKRLNATDKNEGCRSLVVGIWEMDTTSESSLAYVVSTFENILYLTGINPLKLFEWNHPPFR